jgi:glycosyltransferase involved in cell wall biosynthesis
MEKVHIIIPTYNRAHTIVECINSVIAQTFSDWKLTIIDNNSSDQTRALIKEKFQKYLDKKIFYIKYSETLPIIQNWNRCLSHLNSSKYFKLLWSDDTLEKDFLKIGVGLLDNSSSEFVGFCCALNYVNLETKKILKKRKYGFFGQELWATFFYKNILGSPTPQLLKTNFFTELKFEEKNRYAADMIYAAYPYFQSKRYIYSSSPLANLQLSSDTETSNIYGTNLMTANRKDFRDYVIKNTNNKMLVAILKFLNLGLFLVELIYFKFRKSFKL